MKNKQGKMMPLDPPIKAECINEEWSYSEEIITVYIFRKIFLLKNFKIFEQAFFSNSIPVHLIGQDSSTQ